MSRNVLARTEETTKEENVIYLDLTEEEIHSNIRFLTGLSSVQELGDESTELLRSVMQVTFSQSRYSVNDTYKALLDSILSWERLRAEINRRMISDPLAYNTFVASLKQEAENSGHKELKPPLLHRMLPVSYAVWAAVYLVAASVFWTMFAYGLASGEFVLGPWLNLMLCVASTGLLATVVTAIIEWRLKHRVKGLEE